MATAGPSDDPPSPRDIVAALETALGDAIARAEPSVVAIARERSADGETTAIRGAKPAARPGREPAEDGPGTPGFFSLDYGSGVVIGEAGEILTAYHVVKGAARLRVRAPGPPEFDAEIIAADPRSDLAVIAPRPERDEPAPKLRPLALGDASKLHKGSFLIALGNPYNAARDDGKASASWGILSNVARKIDPPPDPFGGLPVQQFRNYPTLLQLDSKLHLGMSGGAVIDMKGELVGLTTAAAGASGFDVQAGYAIPIDTLGRRVAETLKQGKEVEYGFLGVSLLNDPSNRLERVDPNTPAALSGLLHNDTIVDVDGMPVVDNHSLTLALSTRTPGKPVKVKVRREDNGEEKTIVVTVVLSKYPIQGEVIATNRPAPWRGLRVDFTSVMLGATDRDILKAMAQGGVGIVEVAEGSPAEAAGLRKGQVVQAVNGRRVRTPGEFAEAVAKAAGEVGLTVATVEPQGTTMAKVAPK